MTSDRWKRVERLFEEAREHLPEHRDSFLLQACGDDSRLRDDVVLLLDGDERAPGDFMKLPELDPSAEEGGGEKTLDPLIGQRVSQFRITGLLALGGMGTVYLAEQEQPKRTVALKVLREGLASPSMLRRFDHESQILARLRHPGIAQVYEAGTHKADGRSVPFFAMELIPDAQPITNYTHERGADTRERLRLFQQVCEAVQHGHQKGVIHRDLKPSNILVDTSGSVKIIDFGVARCTDSDLAVTTMHTDVGQLIGTLQYMSPEQCEADPLGIDTRSDVYSLGVVLYELLTGRLPYDVTQRAMHSAARVICEQPPDRPSTLDRNVKGNLETIVLKALEKDRNARYQSASDLGRDIEHYLSREPIEAAPPTVWTRYLRWVARHPMASSALGSLMIAATILSTVYFTSIRPHATPAEVQLLFGSREAWLLAADEHRLHRWKAYPGGSITGALFLDDPSPNGDRRVAVIGYDVGGEGKHRGQVCAYDVTEGVHEEPDWCGAVETSHLPSDRTRNLSAEEFGVQAMTALDIFPERDGDEIVVVYNHYWSRRVIHIYSLNGELLYQVWHDGDAVESFWMADPELLVFAGTNAIVQWRQRGHPEVNAFYPHVVWAIHPELGGVHSKYICTDDAVDCIEPAWYKCLLPGSSSDTLATVKLRTPERRFQDGAHCNISCYYRHPAGNNTIVAGWVIDEHGEHVDESWHWSDGYTKFKDKLVQIENFHLGPLPPIVSKNRD